MPEPSKSNTATVAPIAPEDLSRVRSLFSALDTDPIKSEALNPMAKILRQKLGIPEPEQEPEEVDEPQKAKGDTSDSGDDSEPVDDYKPTPKSNKDLMDDDDSDIDALLNESQDFTAPKKTPPKGKEKAPEPVVEPEADPFDMAIPETDEVPPVESADEISDADMGAEDPFGDLPTPEEEPVTASDDLMMDFPDETPTEESAPAAEDDPFAGFDEASSDEPSLDEGPQKVNPFDEEANPFGQDDFNTDADAQADPFASLDEEPAQETPIEESPFDFTNEATEAKDEEDITGADFEMDLGDPVVGDPFKGLDKIKPKEGQEISEDPFIEIGSKPEPLPGQPEEDVLEADLPQERSEEEIFNDLNNLDAETDIDDPFKTDDTPDAFGSSEEDPFAALDDESKETPSPEELGTDEVSSVDEFSPEADTEEGSLGEIEDSEQESGYNDLESDLTSLAQGDEEHEEGTSEEDFSETDLAAIQQEIIKYPSKLRRIVIDTIVNDRMNKDEIKELIELIKHSQTPEEIANFLSEKLGYPVELHDVSGKFAEDGVPIISTDPSYTKEGELRRRQFIRKTILGIAAGFLLLFSLFTGYKYVYKPMLASSYYGQGLDSIRSITPKTNNEERNKKILLAEDKFREGEKIVPNDLEYLNRYGLAYAKIGESEKAFEKLFGKVEPNYDWKKINEVPIIELTRNTKWDNAKLPTNLAIKDNKVDKNNLMEMTNQDHIPRKIWKAGAYIVSELAKGNHDVRTYINLAKFHSRPVKNSEKTLNPYLMYKNDILAENYFKQVFTDGGLPNNIEATSGLGKIHYNNQDYTKSVYYYNKIIEKYPNNEIGHAGLLNNYIEMWKIDNNPQFVINHHRQVRNALDIEDKLPLYILTKLAAFYIDLDSSEVRIKYNINPADQVTEMDVNDEVIYLLDKAFNKSERHDDVTINGSEYSESYYQRGRFYIKNRENLRALNQFELAANFDPAHYPAVVEMAEYYMKVNDHAESIKLLDNAAKRYEAYNSYYGAKDEDETLIHGDPGKIFFNKGKIIFFESAKVDIDDEFNYFLARKIYPDRSMSNLTPEDRERRKELEEAKNNFNHALALNLKNPKMKRELYYYKGWIDYMQSNWEGALDEWSNLGEDDIYSNTNLLLGKANSYYYTHQYNAALGNYMKLQDDYEDKANQNPNPNSGDYQHDEIYHTLYSVYNNIGAIYDKKGKSEEALNYYWRSLETARKIGSTSEIANSNKDLVFRNTSKPKEPLLEDWLSPKLDSVR